MMKALLRVERDNMKKKIPEFSVGDTIRVHVKVIEGEKIRSQVFQGIVIGRRGGGLRETFIVRKISANIAVERIFPVHSPNVVKIERIRKGRVRRAQLTYMKDRKGKRIHLRDETSFVISDGGQPVIGLVDEVRLLSYESVSSVDLPQVVDIVADGVTGFLTPPGDDAAFAERLRALLADPSLRARLGANAADRVARDHGMTAAIGTLADALAIARSAR